MDIFVFYAFETLPRAPVCVKYLVGAMVVQNTSSTASGSRLRARSRSRSDNHAGCHSLRSRRFATLPYGCKFSRFATRPHRGKPYPNLSMRITGAMPMMLCPCMREEGDISAPVERNSTRPMSPHASIGRKCVARTDADVPQPLAPEWTSRRLAS